MSSSSASDGEVPGEVSGEYTVERIIGHGYDKDDATKSLLYHIKWKNYDLPSDNTWEPTWNLSGCCQLLNDYIKTNSINGEMSKGFKLVYGDGGFSVVSDTVVTRSSSPDEPIKKEKVVKAKKRIVVESDSDSSDIPVKKKKHAVITQSRTASPVIPPPKFKQIGSTSTITSAQVTKLKSAPVKNLPLPSVNDLAAAHKVTQPKISIPRTNIPPTTTLAEPAEITKSKPIPVKSRTVSIKPVALPLIAPNSLPRPSQTGLPSFKKKKRDEKDPTIPFLLNGSGNQISKDQLATTIRAGSLDARKRTATPEIRTNTPPLAEIKEVPQDPRIKTIIKSKQLDLKESLLKETEFCCAIMPSRTSINGIQSVVEQWKLLAHLSNVSFALHPCTVVKAREFLLETSLQWQEIEQAIITEAVNVLINEDLPPTSIDPWETATSMTSSFEKPSAEPEEIDQLIDAFSILRTKEKKYKRYIILTGPDNHITESEKMRCRKAGVEMASFESVKRILGEGN